MTILSTTRGCVIAGLIGLAAAYLITHLPERKQQDALDNPLQQKMFDRPQSQQELLDKPQSGYVAKSFLPDRLHKAADFRAGRRQSIDTIVLHTTEGTPAGAETWLTSPEGPEVSAHYLIWPKGEVVELVSPADTAYHVRGWNDRSLGIEIAGYFNKPITPIQIKKTAELVSHLLDTYQLPFSAIKAHSELDPSRRKDPGEENLKAIKKQVRQLGSLK